MVALCGTAVVCPRQAKLDRGAKKERGVAAFLPVVNKFGLQPEQQLCNVFVNLNLSFGFRVSVAQQS